MESEQVWEGCKYGVECGKMSEKSQLRFVARTVLPCISEKHVHTGVGAWGLGRRHSLSYSQSVQAHVYVCEARGGGVVSLSL